MEEKKKYFVDDYVMDRFIKGDFRSLYYHEIFDRICSLEQEDDKVEAMRNNSSTGMMQFLFYVYDKEQIQFDISYDEACKIDYRKPSHTDDSMAELTLKSEWRNLSTVNGKQPKDKRIRFLQKWFEMFCAGETELVQLMFKRSLVSKYPCITESFVRKCFPNLLTPKKEKKAKR